MASAARLERRTRSGQHHEKHAAQPRSVCLTRIRTRRPEAIRSAGTRRFLRCPALSHERGRHIRARRPGVFPGNVRREVVHAHLHAAIAAQRLARRNMNTLHPPSSIQKGGRRRRGRDGDRGRVDSIVRLVYKGARCSSRSSLLAFVALPPDGNAPAQLLAQDHPGQYAQEDIARGAVLYGTQCNQCHGRDGDQMSGVDLRRGQFRRAQSDEDLAQVITRGDARRDAALRPPARRAHGHRRLHSRRVRHHRLDPGRRCGARTDRLRRQGAVRHLPSRGGHRAPPRARPQRHRHRARAGGARAIDSRSVLRR